MGPSKIIKRDGRVVDFDRERIVNAIFEPRARWGAATDCWRRDLPTRW